MKTLIAALLATLSLSACVVAPVGPPAYATVRVAPPPPRVQYIAPMPAPGFWFEGNRHYDGPRDRPHHHGYRDDY